MFLVFFSFSQLLWYWLLDSIYWFYRFSSWLLSLNFFLKNNHNIFRKWTITVPYTFDLSDLTESISLMCLVEYDFKIILVHTGHLFVNLKFFSRFPNIIFFLVFTLSHRPRDFTHAYNWCTYIRIRIVLVSTTNVHIYWNKFYTKAKWSTLQRNFYEANDYSQCIFTWKVPIFYSYIF